MTHWRYPRSWHCTLVLMKQTKWLTIMHCWAIITNDKLLTEGNQETSCLRPTSSNGMLGYTVVTEKCTQSVRRKTNVLWRMGQQTPRASLQLLNHVQYHTSIYQVLLSSESSVTHMPWIYLDIHSTNCHIGKYYSKANRQVMNCWVVVELRTVMSISLILEWRC